MKNRQRKQSGLALLAVVSSACLENNSRYRTPPDMAEVCTPLDGGGGGCAMNRPDVPIPSGMGQIGGVSYPVNDFYLDVFEVTVGAYRDCVARGPCSKPSLTDMNGNPCTWTDTPGMKEDRPIGCVDWFQATAFCTWVGRRLPTEGEWAYAAYGVESTSTYPWGNDAPVAPGSDGGMPQLCWDRNEGDPPNNEAANGTCPVGSYPKTLLGDTTSFGVEDLAGNVWEFTSGQYNSPYTSAESPCTSNCSQRGGSWSYSDPTYFSAAYRSVGPPTDRYYDLGFRCARSAP